MHMLIFTFYLIIFSIYFKVVLPRVNLKCHRDLKGELSVLPPQPHFNSAALSLESVQATSASVSTSCSSLEYSWIYVLCLTLKIGS